MHAAERYEGVVDKLRECNEHLEGTKDTALRGVRTSLSYLCEEREIFIHLHFMYYSIVLKSLWQPTNDIKYKHVASYL